MPAVEKRYAEALIDLSLEQDAIDSYLQDFSRIMDVFGGQAELKSFLLNLETPLEAKKEAIGRIFGTGIRTELLNLLLLLLDRGRLKILPGIFEQYVKLSDEKRNILKMTIISAAPIGDEQIEKIKEKYRNLYNFSAARANFRVDKSLIGGIKVVIGDKVYDGSIKGRLEELEHLITGS